MGRQRGPCGGRDGVGVQARTTEEGGSGHSRNRAHRWEGGRRGLHDRSRDDWKRSEEHTSELQSRLHLVCRLLLEKKKKKIVQIQKHSKDTKKTMNAH